MSDVVTSESQINLFFFIPLNYYLVNTFLKHKPVHNRDPNDSVTNWTDSIHNSMTQFLMAAVNSSYDSNLIFPSQNPIV